MWTMFAKGNLRRTSALGGVLGSCYRFLESHSRKEDYFYKSKNNNSIFVSFFVFSVFLLIICVSNILLSKNNKIVIVKVYFRSI